MSSRILAALVVMACLPAAQAKPPENWRFQGWNEAVAQAGAEKKPLFVMFGYEDCQWCEHLYRRGMNDTEVRTKYAQSTVPTYVDTKSHRPDEEFTLPGGAKITHGELIKRFQAYPTPSWVFLSPTGTVLHGNRNGRSTPRDLLRDVEAALARQ